MVGRTTHLEHFRPSGLFRPSARISGHHGSRKNTANGVSLPDGIFRVRALGFDELPSRAADRERLIRWRLGRLATFDLSGAVLQYQIGRRQDRGITVLACAAKRDVIAQYETLLTDLGLEHWAVGVSSFYTVNFTTRRFRALRRTVAVAWWPGTLSPSLSWNRDSPGSTASRSSKAEALRRREYGSCGEIDDSLHFYTHMDRSQQPELGSLSLPATRRSSMPLLGNCGPRRLWPLRSCLRPRCFPPEEKHCRTSPVHRQWPRHWARGVRYDTPHGHRYQFCVQKLPSFRPGLFRADGGKRLLAVLALFVLGKTFPIVPASPSWMGR